MFSTRGDVHKFYLKLRKKRNKGRSFQSIKELTEIDEIQSFYITLDNGTLKKIYYYMIKEKSGLGIVPIFVSAVPWLLFLFAEQLQHFLFREGNLLFVIFISGYMFLLTLGTVLHFQEKAWVTVHIEIIQDILSERKD